VGQGVKLSSGQTAQKGGNLRAALVFCMTFVELCCAFVALFVISAVCKQACGTKFYPLAHATGNGNKPRKPQKPFFLVFRFITTADHKFRIKPK